MTEAEVWLKGLQDKYQRMANVEYDFNKRWEEGTDHHPRSAALYKRIAELDFLFNDDSFCFKSGGDGDNGERLMYLLDVAFEEMDSPVVIKENGGAW